MFTLLPATDAKQSHRIHRLLLAAAASAMVLVLFLAAAVAGVVAYPTVVILAGTVMRRHEARCPDTIPRFGSHALADFKGLRKLRLHEQRDELLAAIPTDDVRLAHAGLSGLRKSLQHGIAGAVTMHIVDTLEPVDVEQGAAESAAISIATDLSQNTRYSLLEAARCVDISWKISRP